MGNCYICGAQINELQLDHRDMKTLPCGVCLDEVEQILDFWNEDSVYYYLDNEEVVLEVIEDEDTSVMS